MNLQPLEQELKQRLPSPNGVALAIMDACRRDKTTLQDVIKLVQADPALSGRILAQANSAIMGGRPVASIPEAVSRMGMQAVRQLALTFSLLDQYTKGSCTAFDYAGFWSHSLLMGLAMSEVAAPQRLGSVEELFTCGLLARVGSLALATAYPQDYGRLLSTGTTGPKLLALERELLNIDHLHLSAAMLRDWGIPDSYVDPVAFHEDPTAAPFSVGTRSRLLCQSLHLAMQIADFVVAPKIEQAFKLSLLTDAASKLGIDGSELGKSVDSVVAQWKVWGEHLRITTSSLPSFESIVGEMVRPDQENNAQWLRVLVVEDDPIIRSMLQTWLQDTSHHTVMTAVNGREALEKALEFKPHVVLTDWRMPVMDGLELCQSLRGSEWGQSIYVLMLTSADNEEDLVRAFDAGVDDYIAKPVNMRALSARLKGAWRYVRLREAWEVDHERLTRMASELALSNRQLQQAALTDPLTSLANRRAGLAALSQAYSACTRHGLALSVISIDIDHFKAINDTHGHAAGDVVLRQIANTIKAGSRKDDTVCRWGGEEFLVISPNVNLEDTVHAAERLRRQIAALDMQVRGKPVPVTASFGLAAWNAKLASQDQLLSLADEALYKSKSGGRNRVSVSR